MVVDQVHEDAVEDLKKFSTVVYEPHPSQERLKVLVKDADILVLRSGVTLTPEIFRNAGKLRIIARAGVGTDNIDMPSVKSRGIILFNVPGVSARSVAELTLMYMFALSRKVIYADDTVRKGLWKKNELTGNCLGGRTIGIIGLGHIGYEVARMCNALDMGVYLLVRDSKKILPDTIKELGVKVVDLDVLLRESDFVSIHTPLTDATKNMITAEKLALMKRTAFLINTARAGIIDEEALYDALKSRSIAGAALDVFVKDNTFLSELDNIILTPHIGAMTIEVQKKIGDILTRNIKNAIEGRPVENRIN